MRNSCQNAARVGIKGLLLVVLFAVPLLLGGSIVDRIVVTVNRRPVTQSEWDDAVRFESLLNGKPLNQVTPEQRKQALDRLIDQLLVEQQMRSSSYVPVPRQEVEKRIAEMRLTAPAWHTDEGWRSSLDQYGLTEEDIEEKTAAQVNLLRYLDQRFRPDVRIDHWAVERYYREQFLPQLRRAGVADVPLEDVYRKIEQLLTERRLSELQDEWLRALRSDAEIQLR